MVEVVRRKRKSPILTPSSIPCLNSLPTINITQGCALGCTYCYIQGYAKYPGPDQVILFENTAELVKDELSRKRRLPSRVYFSPSSDAFQYLPEVQEVAAATMAVLLDAGVEISFLTKGFISERFLRLFETAPQLVFAQIGITTLDASFWKQVEPRTAPPHKRIEYARALVDRGVATTARLDPLFPDVSDTDESLIPLLESLRDAGVRQAAASYLFLRPNCSKTMMGQADTLDFLPDTRASWQYQRFDSGCGGGRMIADDDRSRRFAHLVVLGQEFGISIAPCRCKNPTLASTVCGIAGPSASSGPNVETQPVFDFADKR
ncbi:MAG: radical SAM protein [Phycisphaerae bacterium]